MKEGRKEMNLKEEIWWCVCVCLCLPVETYGRLCLRKAWEEKKWLRGKCLPLSGEEGRAKPHLQKWGGSHAQPQSVTLPVRLFNQEGEGRRGRDDVWCGTMTVTIQKEGMTYQWGENLSNPGKYWKWRRLPMTIQYVCVVRGPPLQWPRSEPCWGRRREALPVKEGNMRRALDSSVFIPLSIVIVLGEMAGVTLGR